LKLKRKHVLVSIQWYWVTFPVVEADWILEVDPSNLLPAPVEVVTSIPLLDVGVHLINCSKVEAENLILLLYSDGCLRDSLKSVDILQKCR
jgi:hypothetical protein